MLKSSSLLLHFDHISRSRGPGILHQQQSIGTQKKKIDPKLKAAKQTSSPIRTMIKLIILIEGWMLEEAIC